METAKDGSILDGDRIIYFSVERFVQQICMAGHCFSCGAAPDGLVFEQEHVIPDWLLRKHDPLT